ncbi:flavin monoamine oxidase family protein [Burkholderia cenocepacia]|uniref:flavin monoamine oxidase family protein n=1 Tax=Burkholderia TaxID=32008 RepID=UPI001588C035|nr:FAD-dependent oxidoreductase [Burkholderia cenocepacia]EKS9895885.1 FAD-dependent oxidoreductase [Burkholderia pyrrocinia]EKS9908558.1 FAD-dependent oxidoreductase [Burkholderia pyrrocinia]
MNPEFDFTRLTRRTFGKILVAGAAGLAACTSKVGLLNEIERKNSEGSDRREFLYPSMKDLTGEHTVDVVVVGAGLSGLVAARQLAERQRSVIVLDARSRIGGRMYLEKTIEDGVLDVGGQWVGDTQDAVLALLDRLSIARFDSYYEGRSLLSWNGKLADFDGDVANVLDGQYGTTRADQIAMRQAWSKFLAISRTVPAATPWTAPNASLLDAQTFESWMDNEVRRAYAKWVPSVQARIGGSGGFEPGQTSLLHMAWTQRVGPQSEHPERWLLHGGAGQVPPMLAEALSERIVLAARVTDIERHAGGVTVSTGRVRVHAKAVIVAIPPSLRAGIRFSPELPAVYTGFMQCSPMGSISKVHAVYPTAFWRARNLSGTAMGNLKTCEFIADSSPPSGKPGILTSFIAGKRNVELSDVAPERLRDAVLDDFGYYFGAEAKRPTQFFHFNWEDQSLTGGAFTAYLAPGGWTIYGKGWREPVENIFWAGTETSDRWPGYFDGAVRAGLRAASDVERNTRFSAAVSMFSPVRSEALQWARGADRVMETV